MRHYFHTRVVWSGDRGQGTRTYRGYDRTWRMAGEGQPPIECSNDPRLGGDPAKPNPEELLLAAVSSCHMLWFLHFASQAGVVVRRYVDDPVGEGESESSGAGRFVGARLRPVIDIEGPFDDATVAALHGRIHEVCFCARSVNFEIRIEPVHRAWPPEPAAAGPGQGTP